LTDECVFCEAEATGEAEVVDTDDGHHYVLRLCDECGKSFSVPAGTMVAMPGPIVRPPYPPDRMN
jgi:hypothetical protein